MKREKMIVVGAGMACAGRLYAAGFRVLLLEARDRLGGRIWKKSLKEAKLQGGRKDLPLAQVISPHFRPGRMSASNLSGVREAERIKDLTG